MKKDVAASAAEAVAPKKPEFSLIDEDLLKSRIYTIRGVKVMLDADLAEIYGYSTKDFNRQVKNNIERFAEDFRFQLTKREVEELRSKKFTAITDANDAKDLRCKNCTANISTMSRSNPFVFTEQGIYMLMTVLKGDLAVQQSMALIRLFKQMKDYIAAENAPDVSAGMVALATQTSQNTRDIAEIATDVRTLSNKVERNESFLQKVMSNFIDPSTFKHFLILNGQRLEADVAYTQIYGLAKKSVLIVDDYLDVKTLDLLRCVAKGVSVRIFSEQHGRTRLTESMLADFRAARPDVELSDVRATGNVFHDRYIYLDFGTDSEKLFHCGASSKDAGNKITTIMQLEDIAGYRALFERLLREGETEVFSRNQSLKWLSKNT
ncbi:ORF6N domain-containing protein [Fibrobacter sp.]|uniref:ORF6N domain-containing protein n=1 Tax=Fibrobacter sp. TaxID=35828 RepID=UPI0025C2738D|nr:ORF6N domain-containing protein [Fibrobacter sp.]MCI6438716.1 ORF6N domain-containing protein [Fibrobacter sp.]